MAEKSLCEPCATPTLPVSKAKSTELCYCPPETDVLGNPVPKITKTCSFSGWESCYDDYRILMDTVKVNNGRHYCKPKQDKFTINTIKNIIPNSLCKCQTEKK